MNELETYSKITVENGGRFILLDNNNDYGLYKVQTWKLVYNSYFGDTPVYQIYRYDDGKRIYTTISLDLAYKFYNDLINGDKERWY